MIRNVSLVALAVLAGIGVWKGAPSGAEFIRIDTCLDRGGRYDYTIRRCEFRETHTAAVEDAVAGANRRDNDTIAIVGPVVVAYFATTQAEVDSDGDMYEALADFQYYLPAVASGLAACGVGMMETYSSEIFFMREKTIERFLPRELDMPVGYRMMNRSRADHTLNGVHTDVDLLTAAVEYFELPDDCWYPAKPPVARSLPSTRGEP
jgi:hypothetical protein